MNFFRGLFTVSFIYAVMFAIYQWGYANGSASELDMVKLASKRLENCNEIIVGRNR